ncbi:MAG: hypothetical protein K0U08_05470 [Proteobacteria bacterium]|nr:hypothetical protein [Pseudomonadota bacterium]
MSEQEDKPKIAISTNPFRKSLLASSLLLLANESIFNAKPRKETSEKWTDLDVKKSILRGIK